PPAAPIGDAVRPDLRTLSIYRRNQPSYNQQPGFHCQRYQQEYSRVSLRLLNPDHHCIIYTSDMSVLPVETRLVTFLNVILLILVVIIPYLFDQAVSLYNTVVDQDYASILFAIDYAGTLLILAGFAHIISQEEKQLVHGDQMVGLRRNRNRLTRRTIIILTSLAVPWDWCVLGLPISL